MNFLIRSGAVVISLLLNLAAARDSSARGPELLYRLVSGSSSRMTRTSNSFGHGNISWDELADNIFWPFDDVGPLFESGRTAAVFTLTGSDMPSFEVRFEARLDREVGIGSGSCGAFLLSVSGRTSEGAPSSADWASVSIDGRGSALACRGEAMPRALSLYLTRRTEPAIWMLASPGEGVVSSIDVSWAAVP